MGWPPKPVLYVKQCFAYEIYLSFYILPTLPKKSYVGQYARTAVQIPLCCCFLPVALQVSYSPGWPPTSFLAETGLELLILQASQVLRLQAGITTPNLQTVRTLH